jgi:EAL domain-containing protein
MPVIALCMGTMVHQSLYGGRREATLQTLSVCAAYLLTIGLAAAAAQRGLHPGSSIVFGNLPGIVGAGAVMRVLQIALIRHERSAARDGVLARAAAALLDETDVATIRRIAGEAGAELCALQPGVGALRVRVEDDRATVENSNVRIAIDDFGTGYASLAYLRSLPVHQVKIDRSFMPATDDAPPGADDVARAVLLVGQTLGLETVAEGVELSEQAEALETAGVRIAEGFLFARPMPSDEFAAWAVTGDPVATS